MNWNQYFKLKEKQRKFFWIFFVVVLLIHVLSVKGYLLNNIFVCDKVIANYSLIYGGTKLTYNESISNYSLSDDLVNNSLFNGTLNSTLDNISFNNLSSNEASSFDVNVSIGLKEKVINSIKDINFKSYIWFDCNYSQVETSKKIWIWVYRFIYSPLLVFTDILIALVLSLILYIYSSIRIEHKMKKEKADKEKNGGEDSGGKEEKK